MKPMIFAILFIFSLQGWARGGEKGLSLAVGQGVSSPSTSTFLNFSHGFTYQNPTAASQVDGAQVSLEYSTDEDSEISGTGIELSAGRSGMGVAVGYFDLSCDNCEGTTSAAVAYGASSWQIGLGLHQDDTKALGLILGGDSGHRFGVVMNLDDEDQNNEIQNYGVGYSYVDSSFVITVDVSKQKDESTTTDDEILWVTPGVLVKADFISLSVSYDTFLNDDTDSRDSEAWFGVGFTQDNWDLNFYKDFVSDYAANFVYRF